MRPHWRCCCALPLLLGALLRYAWASEHLSPGDWLNYSVVKSLVGPNNLQPGKQALCRRALAHRDDTLGDDAKLVRYELLAPRELLSAFRFDLSAKILYAQHRALGVRGRIGDGIGGASGIGQPEWKGPGWARHVYAEHLRVWNAFSETCFDCDESGGDPTTAPKQRLQDYVTAFDALIRSVRRHGFRMAGERGRGSGSGAAQSIIPVAYADSFRGDGMPGSRERAGQEVPIIVDGAHRVAAAAALELVPAVSTHTDAMQGIPAPHQTWLPTVCLEGAFLAYPAGFFVDRRGLGQAEADAMAVQFAEAGGGASHLRLRGTGDGMEHSTAKIGRAGAGIDIDLQQNARARTRGHRRVVVVVMLPAAVDAWARRHRRTVPQTSNAAPISGVDERAWRGAEGTIVQEIDRVGNVVYQRRIQWSFEESDGLVDDARGTVVDTDSDSWEAAQAMELLLHYRQDSNSGLVASKARGPSTSAFIVDGRLLQNQLQLWLCETADDGTGATSEVAGGQQVQWLTAQLRSKIGTDGLVVVEGEDAVQLTRTILGQSPKLNAEVALAMAKTSYLRSRQEPKRPLDWWWRHQDRRRQLAPWTTVTDGLDAWGAAFSKLRRQAIAHASDDGDGEAVATVIPEWMCIVGEAVDIMRGATSLYVGGAEDDTERVVDVVYFRPYDLRRTASASPVGKLGTDDTSATTGAVFIEYSIDQDGLDRYTVHFGRAHARESLRLRVVNVLFGTDRVHDVIFRSPDHAYLIGHKVAVATWASGVSVLRSLKRHRGEQSCGTRQDNNIGSAHAGCETNIESETGDEHYKNSANNMQTKNDANGASLRVHSPKDGSMYVLPADVPLSFALHLDPSRLRKIGVLPITTANMSDSAVATMLRQRLHICLAINGAPPPGAPADSVALNASHGLQGYMCLSGPIEQQLGPLSIGGFNAGSHTVGAKLLASGRPKRVLATSDIVLFDVLPSIAPREQQGVSDHERGRNKTDDDTDTDMQSSREDVDRLRRTLSSSRFQVHERQHARLRQYYVEKSTQRIQGDHGDGSAGSILVPRVGLVGNCLRLGGMKMVYLQQARALNYRYNHHLRNEESPTGRHARTGAAAFAVEYLTFVYSGPLLPLLYVAGVPVRRIAFREADVEAAVAFLTGTPSPLSGGSNGDAARARTSVAPPAEELRLFDGLSAAPAPLMRRFFDLLAPILAQARSGRLGWKALSQPVRVALRPLRDALKPLALVSQANSRDTRTTVIFHMARLCDVGARLLELPNLYPPRDLVSEQQWRSNNGNNANRSATRELGAVNNQNAVTMMVAPSQYVATHSSVAALAKALGERVQVIHPMVDTVRFKPQPSHDMRGSSSGTRVITVGMVCRMSAERSPALMLHVARLLGQDNNIAVQYNFVIGGDGPLMPHMRRLARQLGLVPPRLKFLGGVDHDNVPRLLGTFDVFVNTAAGGEIFGVAVAEAMSMARLVVSCSNGAAPELLGGTDEPVGILAPCHDVALLADAVRRAAQVGSTATRERKRIGVLARRHAVRHFSAESFAWRYAALWARALLTRRHPAQGQNEGKSKPVAVAELASQFGVPRSSNDTSGIESATRAPLTITISSPGDGAHVLADSAGPVFAAAEIMLEGGVDATQFMRKYRGSKLCFTALALNTNISTSAPTVALGTAFNSATTTQSGIYLESSSSLKDPPRERRVGCWALQSQRMALVGLQPGRWLIRLYLVTKSGRVVSQSCNAPQVIARAEISADEPPVFPEGLLHDYVSPKRSQARAAVLLPRLRQLAELAIGTESGAQDLSVMDVGSNVGYFSLRIGLELGRSSTRAALPVRVFSVEGGDTAERSKWGMEAAPLVQHRAARARLQLEHTNELCDAVMDLGAIKRFRDANLPKPVIDVSLLLSVLHWLPLGAHDTRSALQAIGTVLLMARTSFVELPGAREYAARPDVQGHNWLPALLASDDVRRYADEGTHSDVSALLLAAAAEVGHHPTVRKIAAFRRFEPNIDRELLQVSLSPEYGRNIDRKTTSSGLKAADCFKTLRDILRCKATIR